MNRLQAKAQRIAAGGNEERQARFTANHPQAAANAGVPGPQRPRIDMLPPQAPPPQPQMQQQAPMPAPQPMEQAPQYNPMRTKTKPMPGTAQPMEQAPQAMQRPQQRFGAPGAGAGPMGPEQRGQMATAALGQMQKRPMQQPGFGGSRFDPNLQSQGGQMAQQAAPQLQGFGQRVPRRQMPGQGGGFNPQQQGY